MKWISTIFFTGLIIGQIFCQPQGLNPELVKSNGIKKATAVLDVESDDPEFENLEVQRFEFDETGRCVRAKYIYPFFDVVTTSEEYFFKFDERGNLTEKMKVYKNVPLTDKDKEYIGLFGQSNDTTVFKYEFSLTNNLLEEIEIDKSKGDTLMTQYNYKDSMLITSVHFSTQHKGQLNPNNCTSKYFYDSLGRLSEVRKFPETLNMFSITTYQYLGNTEHVVEEKIINDFKWVHVFKGPQKRSIEVSQDSLNGKTTKYEYDKNGNLLKETIYFSLSNTESNFYGKEYKYQNNHLLEKQSFDKTDKVIALTDKIKFEYNAKGILLEEKMIYDEVLRYTYRFKYK